MASRLVAAAAAATATAASASSASPLARLVSRRGLAGPTNPYSAPEMVNLWEDPMSPMKWKQSHFIVTTLAVWGVLVYGGLKLFGGEEENKTEVPSKVGCSGGKAKAK